MVSEHICQCPECTPDLAPDGVRQGDGHVAVRFGDGHNVRVSLGGQNVSNEAYEALAGRHGWVLAFRMPRHRCLACRRGGCAERLHGRVTVEPVEVVSA